MPIEKIIAWAFLMLIVAGYLVSFYTVIDKFLHKIIAVVFAGFSLAVAMGIAVGIVTR